MRAHIFILICTKLAHIHAPSHSANAATRNYVRYSVEHGRYICFQWVQIEHDDGKARCDEGGRFSAAPGNNQAYFVHTQPPLAQQ